MEIQLHLFNSEKQFRISIPVSLEKANEIQEELKKLSDSMINAKMWLTGGISVNDAKGLESERKYNEQSKQ